MSQRTTLAPEGPARPYFVDLIARCSARRYGLDEVSSHSPDTYANGWTNPSCVNDHINLALAQRGCSALGGMEHALTQQIGLCAPIHLPLDRLESIDLTLHLAGAPA